MFTRVSSPQVRRFTRLSAFLFGAPRRKPSSGRKGGERTYKMRIGGTRARGRSIFRSLPRAHPHLPPSPTLGWCLTSTLPFSHPPSFPTIPQPCRRFPRRHRVHTCVIRTRVPRKEKSILQRILLPARDCGHLSDLSGVDYVIISGITSGAP